MMKKITIVYFSGTGHTQLMAEAVCQGASSVEGTEANLVPVKGSDIIEGRYRNEKVLRGLADSDAIVFGTPTYMGGASAQMKAFFDASSGIWMDQGWNGKLAGGFTTSGSPSGDKLATLQQISILAAQHGMLWVNAAGLSGGEELNRLGSSLGVMAHTPFSEGPPRLHPGDKETARAYGIRIAELVSEPRFASAAIT